MRVFKKMKFTPKRKKKARGRWFKSARKSVIRYNPKFSLGSLGFPKVLKMKHRYVGAPVQLNCTTGAMATQVWSCNGLYDPDITNAGHQPLYFDQMAVIYNHYHVIGSKITIKVQTSEDPVGPSIGCIWIDDDASTTATNLSMVGEQQRNTLRNFGGPNSNPNTTWVKKWSAKKTFPGSVMSNNDLKGSASANPTEQSYFKFSYNTLDVSSATIYITAVMEFVAIWNELKEVAQS